MKGFSFFFGVLLFAVLSSFNAAGQTELTTDEAQFLANNPGLQIQNFSSAIVSPGNAISCFSPVDSTNSDCFNPGDILPGILFQNGPVPVDFGLSVAGPNAAGNTNPVNVLITTQYSGEFEIVFPLGNVRAAGIHAGCMFDFTGPCSIVYEVRVLGVGDTVLVATDLLVSDQFNTFIGVTSSEVITKIVLINLSGESFKGVSDVLFPVAAQAENIPTLSEWGMIAAAAGFALVGMFYAMKKRGASA